MKLLLSHLITFKFSRNWGYAFVFGFLLFFTFFIQFLSGVVLALGAHNHITLSRTIHSVTASIIMVFTYIHFYKNLFYRSDLGVSSRYSFISGLLVFILLFCVSFTGYVLPWGQISYWGTKVITNFIDLLPLYGERFKLGVWGDSVLSEDVTLSRFFSAHVLLGCFIWVFIFLHVFIVHTKKSITVPLSSVEDSFKTSYLYPSAYLKDFFSASLLILSYSFYLSLNFNFLEEFLNNCLVTIEKTPFEMSPEWYFLPSFSVLKYFESKTLGIVFSVFILFLVFSSLFVGNYRRYGY